MRRKFAVLFILLGLFVLNGITKDINYKIIGECTTFFKDGNEVHGIINFMSTRHPKIGFINQGKLNLHNVWMINFVNDNWDFPNERKYVKKNFDTIFLRNNQFFYDKVITYSTKFKVFRFKNTKDIHVSKIQRIYFCCTKLPKAYKAIVKPESYTTFLVDGRVKKVRIKYYHQLKTGFEDGLQVNTKDILMINFENDKRHFQNEERYLSDNFDTIFLKNGKYVQKLIFSLNFKNNVVVFQDKSIIDMNTISKIYFRKKNRPNVLRNDIRRYPRRGLRNNIKK